MDFSKLQNSHESSDCIPKVQDNTVVSFSVSKVIYIISVSDSWRHVLILSLMPVTCYEQCGEKGM